MPDLQLEMLTKLRDLQLRVEYLETLEPLQRHQPEIGCEELEFPAEPFGICNGSFEMGPTPNYSIAEGWIHSSFDASSISELTTDAYDGKYAAKSGQVGTGGGANWNTANYYPVHEDIDYELSAMVKSDNNGWVTVHVLNYDADKALIGSTSVYSAVPGVNWMRVTHRVGPNGDIAWTAGTKFARIGLGLQTNAALTNAWGYADMVRFRPLAMADNRFIRLLELKNIASDTTLWTLNVSGVPTPDPNAIINITTTEPGYLHISYTARCTYTATAVRLSAAHQFVRINAVTHQASLRSMGTWRAAQYYFMNQLSVILGPYAPGAYTVDFAWTILNAGETLKVLRRHASVFWTREN